jgi:HD-GYP domain-containing protein (c-di-GMP phosphodiesterase class II)
MTTQKIFIGIDDQVIEAKGEVLTNLLAEIAEMKSKEEAAAQAIADKAEAKAAIADRLGLTQEELALLLG